MVCRRIEINLRHCNKETLNPHDLSGQPPLAHGIDRLELWYQIGTIYVTWVTFVFSADLYHFQ